VHLVIPKVTEERRRRWIGFAVALTVTLTVCDAQQVALPSGASLLSRVNIAALQTMLPEQKAPPAILNLSVFNQAYASRKLANGPFRYFDGSKCCRYALIPASDWRNSICSQADSFKKTRDPPRMDPPFSC